MATMLNFAVAADDAAALRRWADRLGLAPSDLLRDALRAHLTRLAADADIEAWTRMPSTGGEPALAPIAHWGSADDWSDWVRTAG